MSKLEEDKSTTKLGGILIFLFVPILALIQLTMVSAVRPPSYSSAVVDPLGKYLIVGYPLTSYLFAISEAPSDVASSAATIISSFALKVSPAIFHSGAKFLQ